jgi:2'-5' RNA ligase
MDDAEENGEPTGHWLEVELSRRAFRRVRRQARRAGLPVEEFAKHATLAYARGGWDFTTNVLGRARWARSHGGHLDE